MLFNSIDFAIFLPIVFLLYWLVFNKRSIPLRNIFLLACSYFFYGMWNWKLLGLIIFSSAVDYIVGYYLGKSQNIEVYSKQEKLHRKIALSISVITNLGLLCCFKYYNFFIESLIDGFAVFGTELSINSLEIILPVGISFYTFQTMSYTLDIYSKKLTPTKDVIAFFAFVSFFPQLVAGPIERARQLLPQFGTLKKFNYGDIKCGCINILIGLLKKIVIADRLAIYVDELFAKTMTAPDSCIGLPTTLGLVFFAFQLYIDFSAYSQIALGTAKLFGFDLSINFRRPYLSNSFNKFWERWHITLSQWIRDYLFIPLGGSRKGKQRTIINIIIVFALSGLWHGASWNFVIWGVLNSLFLIIIDPILRGNKLKPNFFNPILVFLMWTLSLTFFRAPDFDTSLTIIKNLGLANTESIYNFGLLNKEFSFIIFTLICLIIFEVITEKMEQKGKDFLFLFTHKAPIYIRWAIFISIPLAILLLGIYATNNNNSFIYFQF